MPRSISQVGHNRPYKIDGVLPFAGGYSINWSISTEIGMYLIFVGWVALCAHFGAKRSVAFG